MAGYRKAGPLPKGTDVEPARAASSRLLDRTASAVERWAAGPWGIGAAAGGLLLWAVFGPITGYSEAWQLLVNTGTTIVTFLMVFLLQRTQSRQARATQLKLDELVAAVEGASNRLIDSENLSDEELARLEAQAKTLAERARRARGLRGAASIDDERLAASQPEPG
jgi:low affinity Fe/Cu permease